MTAVDPGANTPLGLAHPGDGHAERIRAALDRLRPEHRAAKTRTVEEQAAIKARALACATAEDLTRAADRVAGRG